jgi:hypothetical protein
MVESAMQSFVQTNFPMIAFGFFFLVFYLSLSAVLSEMRKSTDRIVHAITELEFALKPADDHPMYRAPEL